MTRVTYPHLGELYITTEHFFRALGLEPVTPPFASRRTLELGIKHCPEMTCAPCKIVCGNYQEGLELGADRLVLFGGPDTCRLGYLARPQAERLHDAGFQFTPHPLSLRGVAADIVRLARELAEPSPLELVEAARTLLASIALVDDIEAEALRLRPRQREPGATTRLRTEALQAARACEDRTEIQERREAILAPLRNAPRGENRRVFRLGLLGDAYSISEPFFNMNLEQRLGRMGVEVDRWFWLSRSLRLPLLERVRQRSEHHARDDDKEHAHHVDRQLCQPSDRQHQAQCRRDLHQTGAGHVERRRRRPQPDDEQRVDHVRVGQ